MSSGSGGLIPAQVGLSLAQEDNAPEAADVLDLAVVRHVIRECADLAEVLDGANGDRSASLEFLARRLEQTAALVLDARHRPVGQRPLANRSRTTA